MRHWITASRTTPTLWVLVIITGPSRKPDSSIQVVPVISPLPFSENQPANDGLAIESLAARQDRGDAGAHRPLARRVSGALARDDRGVADLDAGDVGDGVERPGRAVERHAEIARPRRPLGPTTAAGDGTPTSGGTGGDEHAKPGDGMAGESTVDPGWPGRAVQTNGGPMGPPLHVSIVPDPTGRRAPGSRAPPACLRVARSVEGGIRPFRRM